VDTSAFPAASGTATPGSVKTRIESLIASAPIMVFMKGIPSEPKCGFSRQVVGILEDELHLPYGSVNILADEELRAALKTYSDWPTFPQIYVGGEFVGGLDILKEQVASGEFQALVAPHVPDAKSTDEGHAEDEELHEDPATAPVAADLPARLHALTHAAHVLLFMKGNRHTPQCGFSRQIITLLEEMRGQVPALRYKTFDILTNEEVRQGLKAYSAWPTYPQLYIRGELAGGLDIVKEMVENGELLTMLQ
jgi:Grx4 family monothiol glutaredoxin